MRTNVILAGKCDSHRSHRHSTTSFSENVVEAKTSYEILGILSFSDRKRALPPSTETNELTVVMKKVQWCFPREVVEGVDLPCHSSSSLSLCFPILPSLQCFLSPFLLLSLYSLLMPLPSFLPRWFHLRIYMYRFFIVLSHLAIPLCSFVFRCLTQ